MPRKRAGQDGKSANSCEESHNNLPQRRGRKSRNMGQTDLIEHTANKSSYFRENAASNKDKCARKRSSSQPKQTFASKVKSMKLSDCDSDLNDFESEIVTLNMKSHSEDATEAKKIANKPRKGRAARSNASNTVEDKLPNSEIENKSKKGVRKPRKKIVCNDTAKDEQPVNKTDEKKGRKTGIKPKSEPFIEHENNGDKAITKKRKSDCQQLADCTETKKIKGKIKAAKMKCGKSDVDVIKSEKLALISKDESDDDDFMDVDDKEHKPPNHLTDSGEPLQRNRGEPCIAVVGEIRQSVPKNLDHNDAMAVLLHMEGTSMSRSTSRSSTSGDMETGDYRGQSDSDGDDSDSEAEWEHVEDHHRDSPKKSQLPNGPVEITLEAPVVYRKKKKREFDLETYFRRQINKFKREVAMDIHKAHLMCLVARCQYLNNLCLDETVKAQVLSITMVTKEFQLPATKSCTDNHIARALTWIRTNSNELDDAFKDSLESLPSQVRLVLVCVVLFRQLGILTRLVASLQPISFKETSKKAKQSKKGKETKSQGSSKSKLSKTTNKDHSKTVKTNNNKTDTKRSDSATKTEDTLSSANAKHKLLKEKSKKKNVAPSKAEKTTVRRQSSERKCRKQGKSVYRELEDENEDKMEEDCDSEFVPDDDDDKNQEVVDDDMKQRKNGRTKEKGQKRKGKVKEEMLDSSGSQEMSDSDFEGDSILIRTQQLKKQSPSRRNTRILSTDDEQESNTDSDYWIEIFLEKEQRWLCVDCMSMEIKKPYMLENSASKPICYVLGICPDGYMKDITRRYASQWLTETRKCRTDPDWWEETLRPYRSPDTQREELEDRDLVSSLQQQPLPTTVSAFKNHPLYALKRHLLKFEALYPDTAIPVGYIRGEPVYARECVHTLHSRENWIKEGRAVRIGEEPYKCVKSRPKWNRPKEDPDAKDLETFGRWQTELYIPPPAVDGKVPRNAHGNVEMFLPSMLPAGTVHVKIPGLNKVAKKLDIDCAPAMVGWDNHCGFSHPLMDGWIVCEEFKDILLAAWDEEQEIIKEKEAQKREKRVYENWRKLIRGLLIKERLKKRFDLEEKKLEDVEVEELASTSHTSEQKDTVETKTKTKGKKSRKAKDKDYSWPQNRLTEQSNALCEVEKI